jgi:hypothetical protein
MPLKEVRKQNRNKMADVINALKRRKNKEGIAKEERLKEDEGGRKKKRKEKRKKIFCLQSGKETRIAQSAAGQGLNPAPRLYTV